MSAPGMALLGTWVTVRGGAGAWEGSVVVCSPDRSPDRSLVGREVAVVGGGPGGLMAAEALAGGGATVTVFERMPSVGRKLLLAGRGGLNLTHSEATEALLDRYGLSRGRLTPAVQAFGPEALRAWCAGLGVETFVGTSGRVFPVGLRSTGLLRSWLGRLADLGVVIRTRHTWRGWSDEGGLVFEDRTGADVAVRPDATVLAMGGASWPRVGSDGRWVAAVAAAGIAVAPLRPANCGFAVAWSAAFGQRFQGVPVKNVRLSHSGAEVRGEAVITAAGIEGGAVYAVSAALRDAVAAHGCASLTLDLRPDVSRSALARRLARRRPRDSTATMLRRAGFSPVAAGLLREVSGNQVPSGDELAALAKALPLVVTAPAPIARAISTAGGIAFDEIDEHFMLRRRPGTFVAGEMLDWEAPTGGYLLQATFATAVAAATGARTWLAER